MSDTISTPKNRPVRKIAVLLWNQRYSDKPHTFVEDIILDQWLACGWAKRIGRNKIQINRPDPAKLRDRSASMGPNVMFAIACGNFPELLEAWI